MFLSMSAPTNYTEAQNGYYAHNENENNEQF